MVIKVMSGHDSQRTRRLCGRLIPSASAVANACHFRHGPSAARVEQLRHACKKRYRGTQSNVCTFCGKMIKLDMASHVTNYHLELAQFWRSPVSWCIQWKGTPQDCVDHLHLAHVGPATVKAANLGKWLPPWTVSRETWRDA